MFEHAVDLVLILEIERLWCAVGVDALAIQEEPERVLVHALAHEDRGRLAARSM